jgi:hypothetical protein
LIFFVNILEVAKNLVLAGIKSLRMVDSENLSLEDGTSQFLAPRDKVSRRIQSWGHIVHLVNNENLSLEDGTSQFLAPRDKVRRIESLGQFVHLVFQQREPEPGGWHQPVPRSQGQGQEDSEFRTVRTSCISTGRT